MHKYSPTEWLDENIKVFVEQHQYYTDYALKNWQPVKETNLAKLLKDRKKDKEKIQTGLFVNNYIVVHLFPLKKV